MQIHTAVARQLPENQADIRIKVQLKPNLRP
jgi:hypothetical protein